MENAEHRDLRPGRGGVRDGDGGGPAVATDGVKDPYVGFAPYDEDRQDYLGGRDTDIRTIVSNLRVATLTILYGPSGVGKTSTLCAGVLPRLRCERPDGDDDCPAPVPIYFNEWLRPDFQAALNKACIDALAWANDGPPAFGSTVSLDAIISSDASRSGKVLLVLDQFEDYLSSVPRDRETRPKMIDSAEPGHDHFDRVLARIVNRHDVPAHVLIAIREDEMFRLDRFRMRIPHLLSNAIRLAALTPEQAIEAIRKPLETFNRRVRAEDRASIPDGDDPIPEVIAQASQLGQDDDRRGDARLEPASLQVAMQQLWREESKRRKRNAGGRRLLRRSVLDALGGVRTIMDRYVAQTLAEHLKGRERKIAARIFARLVNSRGEKVALFPKDIADVTEGRMSPRRIRATFASRRGESPKGEPQTISGAAARVLAKLAQAKLLRSIPPDGYDLQHQVLARPVRQWRAEFDRQRQVQQLAATFLGAVVIIAGLSVWYSSWREEQIRRDDQQRGDVFAQHAFAVPARDPALALTLATYAIGQWQTPLARAVMVSTLERVNTGSETWLAGHAAQVTGVNFSPDGSMLASAGLDNAVKLWQPDSGQLLKPFQAGDHAINAALFRPRSSELVTVSDDLTAKIWDVSQPRSPRFVQLLTSRDGQNAHTDEIWNAACSDDGRYLVTASKDGTAKIWNLEQRAFERSLAHGASIVAVAVTGDGRQIATGGLDKTIKVWDREAPAPRIFSGHTDYVYGLSFSNDGRLLASSSWDGQVIIWDVPNARLLRRLVPGGRLWGVILNPSGSLVAASSRDGSLTVWDTRTGEELRRFPGGAEVLTGVAATGGFRTIAAGTMRGDVRLFRIVEPRLEIAGQIAQVAFATDSKHVLVSTKAIGATEGTASWEAAVFDPQHLDRPLGKMGSTDHRDFVEAVAISADGQRLVTGSRDRTAIVWTKEGRIVQRLEPAHADVIQAVAITPRGDRVATGGWDGTVQIWERIGGGDTYGRIDRIDDIGGRNRVSALAFAPDGQSLLVAGAQGQLFLRTLGPSPRNRKLSVDSRAGVLAVAFSLDGSRIAAGFEDGSLVLWQVTASQGDEDLRAERTMPGHDTSIRHLAFNGSGELLASGSVDKRARVWDVRTGNLEFSTPERMNAVAGVAFLEERRNDRLERRLMTVDTSGYVSFQDLDWDRIAEEAGRRGRKLTRTECERYFGATLCPDGIPHD